VRITPKISRPAATSPRLRLLRVAAALVCTLTLAACKVDLYANLDQQEANKIVATLLRHGIPADRSVGKDHRFIVAVDNGAFAEAMNVLEQNGLPKQDFANLGDVFKKDGLVSSPVQERAQMIFALSQELSRTISDIDGVLSARVHLVLPENDPLRQQLIPSSASVFIRHRSAMSVENLVPQVKMLVANGIAGLSYDKVSVVLVPVDTNEKMENPDPGFTTFMGAWVQRDSLPQIAWTFYILIAVIIAQAAALTAFVWRRHRRPYRLGRALPVEVP
jgi:type III secretion protein J